MKIAVEEISEAFEVRSAVVPTACCYTSDENYLTFLNLFKTGQASITYLVISGFRTPENNKRGKIITFPDNISEKVEKETTCSFCFFPKWV